MINYKSVKWSPGWEQIEIVGTYYYWLIEIGYNESDAFPYCVQFGGNGHYFKTLTEARAYCHGRGWLAHSGIYKEG